MWIARDMNGLLFIYNKKPRKNIRMECFYSETMDLAEIPEDFFPEVTWENSPKELVVKEESV